MKNKMQNSNAKNPTGFCGQPIKAILYLGGVKSLSSHLQLYWLKSLRSITLENQEAGGISYPIQYIKKLMYRERRGKEEAK